jgi:hypothetical protein
MGKMENPDGKDEYYVSARGNVMAETTSLIRWGAEHPTMMMMER